MSATVVGWRCFLSWSRFPWRGWWPVPLKGGSWCKALRFAGPVTTFYASLSFGFGHVFATLERKP